MKTREKLQRDASVIIRNLRTQKSEEAGLRLTQADVAYESGLSVRYYNKLENNKAMPTIDALMKIANSYKMTLSDICKLIEEY